MSIKRFISEKDNTITNGFKENLTSRATLSNLGASDVVEIYSLYGQATTSSVEKSRIIIEFPIKKISSQRSSGLIPKKGKVNFVVKLHNAEHSQTIPSNYTLALSPLLQSWSEGVGLDMERYSDTGPSNWVSASAGSAWIEQGGNFSKRSVMASYAIPSEYTQTLTSGLENLEIDITDLVEGWIKDSEGTSKHATASLDFNGGTFSLNEKIKLFSVGGNSELWQFSTKSVSESDVNYFVFDADANTQATNLANAINSNSSLFTAEAAPEGVLSKVNIYQSTPGFFGNTRVSASSGVDLTTSHFSSGEGVKNYGVLIRLSGSFEDGSFKRSYYTKKFFARTSEFVLKRPCIEARYDSSIQDDRGNVTQKSNLLSNSQNLNKIYFYNKDHQGGLTDIANTGSELLVQFFTASDGSGDPVVLPPAGGVSSHSVTFITASRESEGVYSAQFSCTGSEINLYDVWKKTNDDAGHTYTTLVTGSGFFINGYGAKSFYEENDYYVNITNLKKIYTPLEKTTFRVYTRSAAWKPNIYSKAYNTAPVNNIVEGYYKIKRVIDNYEVIGYSTSSAVSYSTLSYDMSGSFFDLDMSILEPRYLYEISFLFKQSQEYRECSDKFRFRVE